VVRAHTARVGGGTNGLGKKIVTTRTLILPAKRLPCGPLSEMAVSRPQYRFRVGIRALLTNGDNTSTWIYRRCGLSGGIRPRLESRHLRADVLR
jgi:hypothetical protein